MHGDRGRCTVVESASTSLYNAGSSSRGECRALQLSSALQRSTSLQLYSALHSTSSTPSLRKERSEPRPLRICSGERLLVRTEVCALWPTAFSRALVHGRRRTHESGRPTRHFLKGILRPRGACGSGCLRSRQAKKNWYTQQGSNITASAR